MPLTNEAQKYIYQECFISVIHFIKHVGNGSNLWNCYLSGKHFYNQQLATEMHEYKEHKAECLLLRYNPWIIIG